MTSSQSFTHSDPVIECPHCHKTIKLTESLALPLLKNAQAQADQQINILQTELAQKNKIVEEERQALRQKFHQTVNEKLEAETLKIKAEQKQEQEKQQEKHQENIAYLQQTLKQQEEKVQQAQAAELETRKQQDALLQKERELELIIQKRSQEQIAEQNQKAQEFFQQELLKQKQQQEKQQEKHQENITYLQQTLKQQEEKVQQAQAAELETRKQQDALLQKERELELIIQKRSQEQIAEQNQKNQEFFQQELLKQKKDQQENITYLQQTLKQQEEKVQQAQAAELETRKQQDALLQKERELELIIQKRSQEQTQKAQQAFEAQTKMYFEQEKQAFTQNLELRFKSEQSEKDLKIQGLQTHIEELNKKAQQGSQQLQGEAFEIELEGLLAQKFPQDQINDVPKGIHGADLLQIVCNTQQKVAGTIIWELKNTKKWSADWLDKLRHDQRQAKADVAILLSYALPFKSQTFEMIDGVWVAHPKLALPLAIVLREGLLALQKNQLTQQGIQHKSEQVYAYLNSPQFRMRLEAIIEAFSTMKDDLEKEKRAITKQWDKRDKQIERVVQNTIGMYGDLQGIAGQDIQTIPALEFDHLLGLDADSGSGSNSTLKLDI